MYPSSPSWTFVEPAGRDPTRSRAEPTPSTRGAPRCPRGNPGLGRGPVELVLKDLRSVGALPLADDVLSLVADSNSTCSLTSSQPLSGKGRYVNPVKPPLLVGDAAGQVRTIPTGDELTDLDPILLDLGHDATGQGTSLRDRVEDANTNADVSDDTLLELANWTYKNIEEAGLALT